MNRADSWDDAVDAASEAGFKRLTREEAQALRAKLASVSPWWVVAAQALAGVLCAVLAWLVTWRSEVGWSALYGAAAVVFPSALLVRGMSRTSPTAVAAAAGFLVWEMVKIGAAVAMLLLAPQIVPRLSWPALLVAMLVCVKVNWLALLWRRR